MVKNAIEIGHQELDTFRAKNGFGRAIAAPQFGFSIQLIALNLNGEKINMLNPLITYRSPETFFMWDDCLSFPHLMVSVRRHVSISVSFVDQDGVHHEWNNLSRDVSELLQHEIDHLHGVLAVDVATAPPVKQGDSPSVIQRADYLEHKAVYDGYMRDV